MNNETKDLIATLIFVFFAFITLIALPYLAVFGGGGLEEKINFDKVALYGGGIPLLVLAFYKIARYLLAKKERIFKYLDVPIFDPENSIIGQIKNAPIGRQLYKIISNPLLLILSTLIISIAGATLFGAVQNTAIGQYWPNSGIPQFAPTQQITEEASLLLAVEPASTSETIMLFVVHSIFLLLFSYLFLYKLNSKALFIASLFILPFIDGGFWALIHMARYSNVAFGIWSTFFFGLIQGFMFVFTFSVFPAIIYHQMNNLVQKSLELFGQSTVVPLGFIVCAVLFLIFIFAYTKTKDKFEEPSLEGL